MSDFNLSFNQLLSILDRIGVKYESTKPDGKGRLSILCPHHYGGSKIDQHFGNAYIYTNYPYAVNCYACKYKTNIIKVVCHKLNISYGDAFKFLKNELNIDTSYGFNVNENLYVMETKKDEERIEVSEYEKLYLKDFNPEDFHYTRSRGITKDFIDRYNIKYCFGGARNKYTDYMIIPIVDKVNGVNTFEARRITEFEMYQKFFETKEFNLEEFRELFESFCQAEEVVYNRREKKIYSKRGGYPHEPTLEYLLKPKTLYPFNSKIVDTIFDYENLDKSKPLLTSEGTASLSKMQMVYDNCSCVFGVNLSEKQIELLLEFEELWIIPDYNEASNRMIEDLNEKHKRVYIMDIKCNDEHENFHIKLNEKNLIKASNFLKSS